MIAVFTRYQSGMEDMRLFPRDHFVRISGEACIDGRTFTGVILCSGWSQNDQLGKAFVYLKMKQPELFKEQ